MNLPMLEVTGDEMIGELLAMLAERDQMIAALRASLKRALSSQGPVAPNGDAVPS